MRNMLKSLLIALLEPTARSCVRSNSEFDYTQRLALAEELKTLPWAAVWNYYCALQGRAGGHGLV